jgi:hypothetical protein
MRLNDQRFRYTPSSRTDVMATWMRFGYRPLTEAERAEPASRARRPADGVPAASRCLTDAPEAEG